VVGAGNTGNHQIEDLGFALIPEVLPQRELTSLLCAIDELVHRRGRAISAL